MIDDRKFDPRDIPIYSIPEAAQYLRLRKDRLRHWVSGWFSESKGDKRFFRPLIELSHHNSFEQRPQSKTTLLSFTNLVEAHVLMGIFQATGFSRKQLSTELDCIKRHFSTPHLYARIEFQTEGIALLFERFGQKLAALDREQEARQILESYFDRIVRDRAGLPLKLYPFTKPPGAGESKTIKIDPRISFGRPVLAETGIPTAMLAERYKAGDSIDELAEDYNCDRLQIEEGIRSELPLLVA
ncbi:MAG: DUF433 domain-containing protein [Oscillatoriales cyanobacterium RU_3_3]|nr:DUF433 domain-containing protein [Microcoleus sp. SU_5_6]NJL69630.1 DUF433 domain-containing protein [Microcoleus sp. SM1_3_4]NJM62661.1 DUF433 domain-containing protein [Oscillatoriales cyanobacterium RU_3_3]NJR26424.1 DUF433 domain-containing protein [Richelia sp. CSU_2_1]